MQKEGLCEHLAGLQLATLEPPCHLSSHVILLTGEESVTAQDPLALSQNCEACGSTLNPKDFHVVTSVPRTKVKGNHMEVRSFGQSHAP